MKIDIDVHIHDGRRNILEEIMANVQQLTDAVQALSDGITALGTSLTAEIAKLDAAIAAAKGSGTGIDPVTLDPVLANLQAQAAALATLKTQADNAS